LDWICDEKEEENQKEEIEEEMKRWKGKVQTKDSRLNVFTFH
jgi:exoribonuclease II